MNDTNAEIKVAISKIARALEGISLGVALIALTTMLIASVLHSTDPKKVADSIIRKLQRVAGGTNDDRNLVDLSKIWHDASEEPEDYFKRIIYQDKTGTCRFTIMRDIVVLLQLKWDDFAAAKITRWAYISDLLPKGGAK